MEYYEFGRMVWSVNIGFYFVCRLISFVIIVIIKRKMILYVWLVWVELFFLICIGYEIYWNVLFFIVDGFLIIGSNVRKGWSVCYGMLVYL